MKEILLYIFILCMSLNVNRLKASSKYEMIQGIWSNSGNGYFEDDRIVYYAYKSFQHLVLSYKPEDDILPNYFSRYTFGFFNEDPVENEIKLEIRNLLPTGRYIINIDVDFESSEEHSIPYWYCSVYRLGFEEDILSIIGGNGNESRFYKVSHLPFKGNQLLYNQSLHDTVDYHRMYLDTNISEIVVDSVELIQKDEKKIAKILYKGDIVEIFSCSDSTAFAGYITNGDEFIEGWVQKDAVEKAQFTRKVAVPKTYIYSTPEEKTKMYLIKNDEIELVEKVGDFWKMTYTTTKGKVIEGYVKRIDCW